MCSFLLYFHNNLIHLLFEIKIEMATYILGMGAFILALWILNGLLVCIFFHSAYCAWHFWKKGDVRLREYIYLLSVIAIFVFGSIYYIFWGRYV